MTTTLLAYSDTIDYNEIDRGTDQFKFGHFNSPFEHHILYEEKIKLQKNENSAESEQERIKMRAIMVANQVLSETIPQMQLSSQSLQPNSNIPTMTPMAMQRPGQPLLGRNPLAMLPMYPASSSTPGLGSSAMPGVVAQMLGVATPIPAHSSPLKVAHPNGNATSALSKRYEDRGSSVENSEDDYSGSDGEFDAEAKRALAKRKRDSDRLYRCPRPDCGKIYKNRNGLKYHLSIGSSACAKSPYASSALSGGIPTPIPSTPSSPYGGALGRTPTRPKNRKETPQEKRPYYCRICFKRYRNSNGLKYHWGAEHGETNFERDVKGKSFVIVPGETDLGV